MPILIRVTRYLLSIVISMLLILLFPACTDKSGNNLAVIKALNESLINSNDIITKQNEMLYSSLKNKLTDRATYEKAIIWQPKATLIKHLTLGITSYIENLKAELKKEAGFKTDDGKESLGENNMDAVTNLFNRNGKGKELYQKLNGYKKEIMSIDSQMTYSFNNTILLTTQAFDSTENKQQNFTKTFFYNIPAEAAIAMLSKFQNNIKIIEDKMLVYCNNKVTSITEDFSTYSAIVAQSSSYVRAGEKIEITAGVGAFSKSALPEIVINGKKIAIDETGVAVYRIVASGKSGKRFIPVKIYFIDQDGKKESITKNVEYTVAKEN